MRVFITGGTGFVGSEVLRELASRGHRLRVLIRPGSEKKLPPDLGIEVASGDALKPETLTPGLAGCQAVIHLVGIIREERSRGLTFERLHLEATENVLAALKETGVRRYLHMSALGARTDSASPYHQTKAAAEEAVMASGLDWTIFRPSVIFGPADRFVNLLAAQIKNFPLTPVIGSGKYRLQPISVKTVAQAFAAAMENPAAVGQRLDLAGPQAYTYDELTETIGRVGGRRPRLVHLPVWLVRLAARLLNGWERFPLSEPQVEMLLEDNTASSTLPYDLLGLEPIFLEDDLAAYLKG